MKVLVVGSGGREHALVWKITQSKLVKRLFCAPGNGGIAELAEIVDIKVEDIEGLVRFAKDEKVDLTVVGPEAPLVEGIVDRFSEEALRVFGPTKELAQLEGSKVFAKEMMKRFNVPTADFKVFENSDEAKKYVREKGTPIVVKADGLAAGKGVIVAKTQDEAINAIERIMVKREFGDSGDRVIVEECLEGDEASILVFSDGKSILPLDSSQDHKRIFDGDRGANTGGMGAYSPASIVTEKIFKEIIEKVFRPIIDGLAEENLIYKGVLYGGLMITKEGPKVLEFNVRFGDPELQAIIPRMRTDLVEVMEACIDRGLEEIKIEWDRRVCLCVVIASKGYPEKYEKGKIITGLDETKKLKDIVVFHAGTVQKSGKFLTNGGRVLGVTALGKDIRTAKERTYEAVEKIDFDGKYFRSDIGYKAIRICNEPIKASSEIGTL